MKNRFASLTVDAFSFKMDPKSPINSINSALFSQYIPPDATAEERRIHKYLDDNLIYMMDVK